MQYFYVIIITFEAYLNFSNINRSHSLFRDDSVKVHKQFLHAHNAHSEDNIISVCTTICRQLRQFHQNEE